MSFPLPSASGFVPSAATHADGTDSDPVPSRRPRPSLAKLDFGAVTNLAAGALTRETAREWAAWATRSRHELGTAIARHEPSLGPHLFERFRRCQHLEGSIYDALKGPFDSAAQGRVRRDFTQLRANVLAITQLLDEQSVPNALILFRDMAQGVEQANEVIEALSDKVSPREADSQRGLINDLILNMDRAGTPVTANRCLQQLLHCLNQVKYSIAGKPLPLPLDRFPRPSSGFFATPPRPSTGVAANTPPSRSNGSAPADAARPSTSLDRPKPRTRTAASDADGGTD